MSTIEKRIDTIKKLFDLLEKCRKTNSYKYRGQSKMSWQLIPACGREGFKNINDDIIFKQWKRRAIHYLEKSNYSEWELLSIAQHNGLPTRLLDWSQNPLVGLFFACIDDYNTDGVLYIIKSNNNIINNYEDKSPFHLENDIEIYQPTTTSNRIANQLGYFTVHKNPNVEMNEKNYAGFFGKYIIPAELKEEIIFMLNQFGINYLSIYPDLEGLAKHLRWFSCNIKYFDNSVSLNDID